MDTIKVTQFADQILHSFNQDIGNFMGGHCVFIKCLLMPPLDDEFRVVVEAICDNVQANEENNKIDHLIVLLETEGGHMETVERLVSVMRAHSEIVSFVIPNYAYSAGTVLALSGDHIFMDYYSVLGPIDPQEPDAEGRGLLPGVGYLEKFKELSKTINKSSSKTLAERTYLVKKFDPALLFRIEQSINHGISLITKWLPKYKFKDWKETETRKIKVDLARKQTRATKIAEVLGDAQKWHSHGRGISMEELTGPDIKLKIEDFGEDSDLSQLIRNYHGLCVDHYSRNAGYLGYIHSSHGIRRVL